MTAQGLSPDRLGCYHLLKRLGEGGMGVVYLAADPLQRAVAVKALRPGVAADPNARRRLAREVETMRRVHSPYVAEVIDADVASEPPYIVTRYVDGMTLDEAVTKNGPLAGPELSRLACGLASALTAVHAAGVVHRDLKPGNVMLAGGEPVVIDFGIAQVPDSTRLTLTGMFMGTPGFLAPEVIEGKLSGPASDVHSWGATVAFAATGRPPFGTGTFETIFYRIVHGQPDLSGLPRQLHGLVAHALARDPARRPSAAELSARLAAIDPEALVNGPAAGPGPAAAVPPGTLMDSLAPAAVAWAPVDSVPAAPLASPVTRPLAGGSPAGLAGRAAPAGPAWPGARLSAAPGADDYRDVLLPVDYHRPGPGGQALRPGMTPAGPSAPGLAGQRAAGPMPSAAGPHADQGVPALSRALAAAAVVVAASASVLLPVAGTLAALTALLALRSGRLTAASLRRRRTRRGSRALDPLTAAVIFPIAFLRSLLRLILLAPLALLAAGLVAAITIAAVSAHPLPQACAYGAGTIVAFYGLGPGSSGGRQPLAGFFGAVARTRVSAVLVFIGIAALTAAAIVAAATHPPYYWPFSNLSLQLQHFPRLHGLVGDARLALLRMIGRSGG